MLRVFHPIGQGAFYSERQGSFNIVYDCGEWKNTKNSTKLVENSFKPNSVIDILFISHFDYDHVSKIDILKQHFKIKVCVLPELHDNQIYFLKAFYRTCGLTSLVSLIENPTEYFGPDTKIIKVKVANVDAEIDEDSSITIEDLQANKEINSGTEIRIRKLDWVYIPYNYEYIARRTALKKLFQEKNIDVEQFKNDIDYALSHKKEIKEIYNQLEGGINFNSMFLYSGPNKENIYYMSVWKYNCHCRCYFDLYFSRYKKVACIYTGDADLNGVDILKVFKKYWNFVGTIQIPHHGSANNFNFAFIQNNDLFIFPLSYGTNNTYGHPSQSVICEIIQHHCYLVPVNENLETMFIQYINI